MNIVTPAANLVGTYYKGKISVNSLQIAGSIGVETLIKIADEIHVQKPSFSLSSAFSNDILGSITHVSTEALDDYTTMLGAECIHYVVLQNAAQDITTSANRAYTLMGKIQGNFGFYPDVTDAFLYNMFKVNPYALGESVLDSVPYSSLRMDVKPPVDKTQVMRFKSELAVTAGSVGQIVSDGGAGGENTLLQRLPRDGDGLSVLDDGKSLASCEDYKDDRIAELRHIALRTQRDALRYYVMANRTSIQTLRALMEEYDDDKHKFAFPPLLASALSSGLSLAISKAPALFKAAKNAFKAVKGEGMEKVAEKAAMQLVKTGVKAVAKKFQKKKKKAQPFVATRQKVARPKTARQ